MGIRGSASRLWGALLTVRLHDAFNTDTQMKYACGARSPGSQ